MLERLLLQNGTACAMLALFCSSMAYAQNVDLAVSKTVDNPSPAPDNPVEFTVTVTNDDPYTAADTVVTDRLPPGLSIPAGMTPFTSQGLYDPTSGVWQVGDIPTRGQAVLTIPATAEPSGLPTCYENIAEITESARHDAITANNTSNASVLAGGASHCAELVLDISTRSKLLDGCGRDVTFDFSVSNEGPASAFHVEVELLGNATGVILVQPNEYSRLVLDEIGVGETVTGEASWWIDCERPAQTADYSVRLSTNTLLSGNSTIEVSGQVDIPKTRGCDCHWQPINETSGCFIATAAHGSSLDAHVIQLRQFRDRYLLTNRPGRTIVATYYRLSPPIAAIIGEHETLRLLARASLAPIVYAVSYLEDVGGPVLLATSSGL